MKLSITQKFRLQQLAVAPLRRSGTNQALCALERRGLAELNYVPSEYVEDHTVSEWTITQAGRDALK